ncbi:MAG TPA: hypothetical protein VJS69_01860 [Candidatus Krumholzibacteria bacterium]|nr:hypothetical protein [Candidatus Krumholzibacteria bacterium]
MLGIATLDSVFAPYPLWVRAAALIPGMVVAGWCLARTLAAGRVDEETRVRWLLMLAGIHIVATLFFFPAQHLFDARPIITADHAVHYEQCLRSRAVFWRTLRLDCYNPYFMAGYPAGTIFDVDMKGAELFTALIPIHTATALKLFILIAYLSMLPSVYRGARMQGFRVDEAAVAVMLLLVFWHWGRPYASDFRYVGMFSFVFATHAVIYVTGLVRRFLAGDRGRALFILGPIAFSVHVLSVVMAAVSIGTLLVADRAHVTRRRAELLFLWALVVVFVNALWILPLIRFLPYRAPSEAFYQLHGLRQVAHLLLAPTGWIATGVLTLAAGGAARLWREKRAVDAAPALVSTLVMLMFATCGTHIPGVNQLEPGRFLFSAIVFATPLAGAGAVSLLNAMSARLAAGTATRLRTSFMVALALAPLPLAMLDAKAYYHHTLSVDLPPRVERLRSLLVASMHGNGRLLIEEGSAVAYGGFFLPALLPSQTGIEQIGGPYPKIPLIYHRTTFDADSFLGRPFAEWTLPHIQARLRFLRVHWAVTVTESAGHFVASIPGVTLRWEDGSLRFWEFAESGGGVPARASYNRVEVDLPVGSTPVVLPYHWVYGLTANDGNQIAPVLREDDPVPFISVRRVAATPVVIRY